MSNLGHCEHCAEDCQYPHHYQHSGNDWGWSDGLCPECAAKTERHWVVCFLDDLADRADDDGLLGRRDTITQIKHQIQQGKHLEEK